MKWREGRVPDRHLVALALLSLLIYGIAEHSTRRELQPRYEAKLQAAKTAVLAQQAVLAALKDHGIELDLTNDPWESGLIGVEHSLVTSDRGFITAKILATNPNAAAAFVEMLHRAHVRDGDRVAIGMTGSMPGWNIAMLAACKALHVIPIIITSVGASDWGANRPWLTWLDMESILRDAGILPFKSRAASLGGGGDNGRGLSPEGRTLLREAIERNGIPLIPAETLEASIRKRMEIYRHRAGTKGISVYVNIGGGIASVGGAYNNDLIPPGYSRRLPPANYPIDAVVNRMSRKGIRIINLTNVRRICARYELPTVVQPDPPALGEGRLFFRERFDVTTTTFLTALLAIIVFSVIRIDLKHYMKRNPRLAASDEVLP